MIAVGASRRGLPRLRNCNLERSVAARIRTAARP
jgi:hypothetical protein